MNKLKGKITPTTTMSGKINSSMIYPDLEDLEVTPSGQEQNFKSSKYGYNNVKVKAVESEELTVTPSIETQVKEGMFNKVTVAGDEDLKAENIKEGVNIFGVEGVAKTTNAKITNAKYLFYYGIKLDYVNEILLLCDWEKIADMSYMFSSCSELTSLDLSNIDTSNVTTMRDMFSSCSKLTSLDVSNFNTSNVTTMSSMFYNTSNLTQLDVSNFNTSNVTTMYNMFYNTSNLTQLDVSNFDTSNVTNMGSMFYYCQKLTDLDLSSFDMSKVTNVNTMFYQCNNLKNLKFMKNLGKGYTQKTENYSNYKLDLSSSYNLSYDSLMSVINNLYDLNLTYDVANSGTLYRQQLKLGSTNLAKLTAEEIAIATNKGWNVI
jgi:surface protein